MDETARMLANALHEIRSTAAPSGSRSLVEIDRIAFKALKEADALYVPWQKPWNKDGKAKEGGRQVTGRHGAKYELFHSYMRGWQAGAGRKSLDPAFTEHKTRPDLKKAYEDGYLAGHDQEVKVANAYAKKIGYKPTILRATIAIGGE